MIRVIGIYPALAGKVSHALLLWRAEDRSLSNSFRTLLQPEIFGTDVKEALHSELQVKLSPEGRGPE